MKAVGRFAFSNPGWVVTVVLGASVAAGLGVTRLKVDTNHINFFPASHPLSRSAAVVDRELSGIYSFNILIEGPPDSIGTPDTLARMDRLSSDLSRLPFVRKTTSVADYVKRINQQLSGGDRRRVCDSVLEGGDRARALRLRVVR